MIAAALKPSLNEQLELCLGEGASVECIVRWVKDGRIGLEFAHETQLHCSDEQKAELLRAVLRHAFPAKSTENAGDPKAPAEKRSLARHPLIWAAEILFGPSRWTARLRNVSPTGALVECSSPPREGSEIVLDLGEAGSVNATVSWVVGDYLGLRFDELFDLGELARTRPQVAPRSWQRPSYLEDHISAGSTWDETWRRMSVDELRDHLEGYLMR